MFAFDYLFVTTGDEVKLRQELNEEDEIVVGPTISRKRKTIIFVVQGERTCRQSLEKQFADHEIKRCKMSNCTGPSVKSNCVIDSWPHTIAFQFGETQLTGRRISVTAINELEYDFTYQNKRFILRSCVLFQPHIPHFVSITKAQHAWVYCDGYPPSTGICAKRFKFYPLDATERDFDNGILKLAFYEVVGMEQEEKPDPSWNQLVLAENEYDIQDGAFRFAEEEDNDENVVGTDQVDQVKELRDRLKGLHEEYEERREKEKRDRRRSMPIRIPAGFSLREREQTRGTKPKCQGCGETIEYSDSCIRHKYRSKKGHKYDKTAQYHCTVDCLSRMKPKSHLIQFIEKKWSQRQVVNVVRELKRQRKSLL